MVAQFWLPVRIGQAAHVEYQVCIDRHAALETKRLDQKRSAWFGLVQQTKLERVAQLIEVQVGGVDLQVGQIDDRAKQCSLVAYRFGQRTICRAQGVAAPGFREALEQGGFVCIQVQHVALNIARTYFIQHLRKTGQMAGQVAGIYRNRQQGFGEFCVD